MLSVFRSLLRRWWSVALGYATRDLKIVVVEEEADRVDIEHAAVATRWTR
jgi:hypothetical protein